ncbi:MAG TPA: hypothetical protein VHG69_07110 [Thermoleophilaceae bacterium]|nr:hypothetical protein [Thermoleophilaceae bacterium]
MAQRGRRQKRKRRQRAGAERATGSTAAGATGEPAEGGYYARSRERDAEARAKLQPLESGERPAAVTVGALIALLLAVANFGAWLAGLEVQGDRPSVAGVAAYSGLMLLVAWGMWKAKYWAVLGMHALLAILIIVFALLAVQAENVVSLLIALGVIAGAGTLFWFLIKAMARIQMPPRPGSQPR